MDGHTMKMKSDQQVKAQGGFTLIELLVVIVVISILAVISIVAYNGVQTRAQNAKRQDDIASIVKGIELYYVDNGRYPAVAGIGAPNTCLSSPSWNCWDPSVSSSGNRLLPTQYLSTMPQDPTFLDSAGCGRPNSYQSRMYAYTTDAAGDGYMVGAYLPGLSTSDPHYFNGSQDLGCMNFVNYLIRKNM